ncbi:hypothetical protein KEM56_005748 [Ascosphaera pollenicola]|nr:hypothetical protein KEM56_005748 [Ascosphaera pollenicola]
MVSDLVHLPNGYVFNVNPAFNGFSFKIAEKAGTTTAFPPGWNIVLQTRKPRRQTDRVVLLHERIADTPPVSPLQVKHPLNDAPGGDEIDDYRPFRGPTLNDDHLFISSILLPPSSGKSNVLSPARHIAMMLYATLWWYFHQKEPEPYTDTPECHKTPLEGRPRGEWMVHIKQEGVCQKRTIQKLERMGLISYEDPIIGLENDIPASCFTSRRAFWQINPRIFLFPLIPPDAGDSSPGGRSSSPSRFDPAAQGSRPSSSADLIKQINNPFNSHSRMPTYYPPSPQQYTFTNGVRHPRRQKAAHQGETVYIRYIPSVEQTLSFRVPVLEVKIDRRSKQTHEVIAAKSDTDISSYNVAADPISDLEYLHHWMNCPRVELFWGAAGPHKVQEDLLIEQLTSRHSFPLYGCWDNMPFGYFEVYWVKEDKLGRLISGGIDDYDRGIHCLVGEEEYRGPHRVLLWLTSLVHYCFITDSRTQSVYLEPRVDNVKFIEYLEKAGFHKEGEVTFPHKQSALMRIKREFWEAPAL